MSEKSWSQALAEQSAEGSELFNHPGGARRYGHRARELEATEVQVVEAIKVLRILAGRPAMVTAVEGLRDGR